MAVSLSDELTNLARASATANHRSMAKQIEHWARIGRIAEDNPDLPFSFIKGSIEAHERVKLGLSTAFNIDDL